MSDQDTIKEAVSGEIIAALYRAEQKLIVDGSGCLTEEEKTCLRWLAILRNEQKDE